MSYGITMQCIKISGVPRIFFGRWGEGGVQQIQLRTEGRENEDLGQKPLVRCSAKFANE
jgi:hypothetical protein